MTDEDIYITRVNIHSVRHLKDIEIPLSEIERKHLIFTGINGSGKTSVLEAIKEYLDSHKERSVLTDNSRIELFFNLKIYYSSYYTLYHTGNHILAFFNAKRKAELIQPNGIKKVDLKKLYSFNDKASSEFIQHIVNLQVDRLFAEKGNEIETVNKIDNWFEMFEQSLKYLFEDNEVKLEFDIKNYDYNIVKKGREKFTFNQLSDGYSAIFDIVSELIMRMESYRTKSYDIQGIVLIDEIETHLHVSLQKKILPFLTSFFPKVQFIVTTHSPFVLSSIENAVICDLQNNIIASDFSGYSYDGIIESYFDIDKYSQDIKDKIEEYERLALAETLTEEEEGRMIELRIYLKEIPAFLSKGLKLKFMKIESKRREKHISAATQLV
ncbi:ATPase AAA [Candidatus Magnetobacterium bavaricum]|uniref:ATPase AAA n=1 Tax=Candidatus Magnetobacterium bavaricum TaxID=29290 RepID=A0A0F3GMC7_9BACT|nr:ATPase AAA [Candidatus Magnetobacterium bavaricum]